MTAEEEICSWRATLTKWQAIINTGRVLSELLPVVSEELRSAHHMKDEEGGGKKQHLVHCLPLSHVPSLFSVPVGGKRRGGWRGGRGWGGRGSEPKSTSR